MLVAVLAAAFNLRAGIVVVAPLIDEIRSDTGMSSALAGVLTTIPFFCMGLFAFLGPPLVRRFGGRDVVVWALALIAAGSLARAAAPNAALVLATTLPIGLGIALIGVTLPAVVKDRFPERGGIVTGSYIAALSVGIIMVGVGLVPLADALGGWRGAFAVSAVPPAIAAALWTGMGDVATAQRPAPADGTPIAVASTEQGSLGWWRRMTPSRTAVLLGLTCGLQSVTFAGMVSWGPAHYQEAGWSERAAAIVITSIGFYTVIASLVLLPASEGRDRRRWVSGTALALSLAMIAIALAPTSAPWLWLTVFGLGCGGIFPLLLALALDLAEDPARAVELTAWMLGLGYLVAGLTPVVTGALRDITGGLEAPMLLLAAAGLLSGTIACFLPPPGQSKRSPSVTR